MAVIDSDLHWYLSSAGASEGGAKSTTEIVDNVDENVFSDVSDVSRIAGGGEIRKIYLTNENGADSYPDFGIWILTPPTNCTPYIALGLESADEADTSGATLTDLSGPARIALVSNGSDTRVATVRGLDASGDPIIESVTLAGAAEVLTVATFSGLYIVSLDSVSGSRTVTIKEGSGGTVRGTIPVGLISCFRWLTPASTKATGLRLVALPTGQSVPIWERFVYAAGAGAIPVNHLDLKTETV